MIFTFVLLAISVCSVWVRDIKISNYALPLWMVFLMAAMISGVHHGFLEMSAVGWVAVFGLLTFFTPHTEKHRAIRALHLTVIGIMAFLLATGKIPGFHNPNIVTDMRFSSDGKPFTQRLPIDGISAGIILLALLCNPVKAWIEWSAILRNSAPIIAITLVVIFGCGLLVNYVSVDVKFIPYTWAFLIANLLFTCVMEESFFRGFLQDNFTKLMASWKYGAYFAMALSASLFGLAHFKGGLLFVALATLAGVFYGYAKYRVKHIEAAILTHFSVNAVHFIAFTYPNY